MGFPHNNKKRSRNISTLSTGQPPVTQRQRQPRCPSAVNGTYLEPEWDQDHQTRGSFNRDTLVRLSQAQAEESRNACRTSEILSSQSSSQRNSAHHSTTSMPATMKPSPMQPTLKSRYYQHALSPEDKVSLAVGEQNHNLKEWKGEDLVRYQISRLELVPVTENRQQIIAEILDDTRASERFLLKSAQQAKRFVGMPLSRKEIVQITQSETYARQYRYEASQSLVDLHGTAPNLPLPPIPTQQDPSREQNRQSAHSGLESNDERLRKTLYSSKSSRNSSQTRGRNRNRAPDGRPMVLKAECMPNENSHVKKEEITFDAFMLPHSSGKGWVHRDSEYAKRDDDEPPRGLRRLSLSRMPSVPELRKRVSQIFSTGQKE